jgi:hypothetical protein
LRPLNVAAAIEGSCRHQTPPSLSSTAAVKHRHPVSVPSPRPLRTQSSPTLSHHLLAEVHRRVHQTPVARCLVVVHHRHRQTPSPITTVTRTPVVTPHRHRHLDLIVASALPRRLSRRPTYARADRGDRQSVEKDRGTDSQRIEVIIMNCYEGKRQTILANKAFF